MKWLLFILCLGLNSGLLAQNPFELEKVRLEQDPFEEEEKVQALVKQLGHDDFKLRQQASDALMQMVERYPDFAKCLQRFANHEDPEVRFRIAELTKVLPVVLRWMNPANEKNVKSRTRSPGVLKLTFKNRSKEPISIYWVDWNGKRQSRGKLQPGEQRTIAKTYIDHYWLITNAKDEGLGLYVARRARDAQIIHTGEEGQKK